MIDFLLIHIVCLSFIVMLMFFTFLLLTAFSSQVEVIPSCSILAAVGQKMASTPGVSATLFDAIAKVLSI